MQSGVQSTLSIMDYEQQPSNTQQVYTQASLGSDDGALSDRLRAMSIQVSYTPTASEISMDKNYSDDIYLAVNVSFSLSTPERSPRYHDSSSSMACPEHTKPMTPPSSTGSFNVAVGRNKSLETPTVGHSASHPCQGVPSANNADLVSQCRRNLASVIVNFQQGGLDSLAFHENCPSSEQVRATSTARREAARVPAPSWEPAPRIQQPQFKVEPSSPAGTPSPVPSILSITNRKPEASTEGVFLHGDPHVLHSHRGSSELDPEDRRPRCQAQDGQPFGQQIRTANEIDDDIRTMARKPILGSKAADKTALGYVYIYRDPERPNLHKIGYTNKEISERQRWIQAKCSITLESIPHGLIPVRNAERAEKLVHAELRNFRRVFTCKCGTKHREWYEVTEKEALRVVRRWDSFLRQVPYDDNGRLIGLWTKRITIMPRPLSGEKPDDHDARHQRWTDVLKA